MIKKSTKKRFSTLSKFNERLIENNNLKQTIASDFLTPLSGSENPWTPDEVDTLEAHSEDSYKASVDASRFFYKNDPLASSAINKIIEIGINGLEFDSNGLSENELRIFYNVVPKLLSFARMMGLEFMLTGLVVPEVAYSTFTKEQLYQNGIVVKKKEVLTLPSSMWIRDSKQVEIKSSFVGDKPSYFIAIPEKTVSFILNKGSYLDGTKDVELYNLLVKEYPEFVNDVRNGVRKIKLDNPLIFRGRYLSDSPYPIPYLNSVIESLKHKRNLRRMDYSLASRVITAIMLVKVGSDEFPVTEDDDYIFDDLRRQLAWRWNSGKPDLERIFQLFANHTIDISWIIPDVQALLDDSKYSNVNKDIIQGLGLPAILIAGETERSGAGGANDYAMISPESTMEVMRTHITPVLQSICNNISKYNSLSTTPYIRFTKINLMEFNTFTEVLANLYTTGNISRTSYDKIFGFNWIDEMNVKEEENKILKEKNLEDFAPAPFSPQPNKANEPKKPENVDKKDIK